jgi:DNA-binding transcriptional LysR family regulator
MRASTLPLCPFRRWVGGLRVERFGWEDAAVAVSVGLMCGHDDEIPLDFVARGHVLAQPRRTNPGFYDAVLAAFRTVGLPSPVIEVGGVSIEHLLLHVAAGAGVALVPRSVADRFRTPGVGLRRLAHSSPIGCELAVVCADRCSARSPGGVRRGVEAIECAAAGGRRACRGLRSGANLLIRDSLAAGVMARELPRVAGAPVGTRESADQAAGAAQAWTAVMTTSATSLG